MLYIGYTYESALGSKVNKVVLCKNFLDLGVCEDSLNACLSIVEVTVDSTNTDIVTFLSAHLTLLHGAYTVIGIENKNFC